MNVVFVICCLAFLFGSIGYVVSCFNEKLDKYHGILSLTALVGMLSTFFFGFLIFVIYGVV